MLLTKPVAVKRTNLSFDHNLLSTLGCGLFRCPLPEAGEQLPELKALYETAPVESPEEWELDIKIHMLMSGQWPCIPNWHCDNVPRIDGELAYGLIDTNNPPMYIWISEGPETEFLRNSHLHPGLPSSHDAVGKWISEQGYSLQKIESNLWYEFGQNTPHRGTMATKFGWRIFARLTHKSLLPQRPVTSIIRRHCQVYLDANSFTW